jgi:RES domain-containing protein
MALVWRLCPPAYARALDGEGNRKYGARWNSPGRGVVYTCQNLSLCVLETYVHFSSVQRQAIPDFAAVQIEVPDDAGITRIEEDSFQDIVSANTHRQIGDRWLVASDDLVLIAPSILIPEEMNVMLNPAHPRMADVRIVSTRAFQFDPRLATANS